MNAFALFNSLGLGATISLFKPTKRVAHKGQTLAQKSEALILAEAKRQRRNKKRLER